MHVPMLRQAACCHGAAILDKRQRQRVFRKNMPSDLIRRQVPFCDQNTRQQQSALRQLW
jgi:hypothetical protein